MKKDTLMMIVAFCIGMFLVSIFFGGSKSAEKLVEKEDAAPVAVQPASNPVGEIVALGEGYFIYHTPEDRFILCQRENDVLNVVDVFKLECKKPTYHSGSSTVAGHGWAFQSLSRERKIILEARRKQFEVAVVAQEWANAEKLAKEIAAVGGVDFLKNWLASKLDWGGRRAAALALAERGYLETVPTLAEMLLEGPDVREQAAELLVKLTKQDYFKQPKRISQQGAIDKYKDWYRDFLKDSK